MNHKSAILCKFIDIGGVLLSNGWDSHAREQAAARFALDLTGLEKWHHLVFETYATGKLTLIEYLDQWFSINSGRSPGSSSRNAALCRSNVSGDDRAVVRTQGAAEPENPDR